MPTYIVFTARRTSGVSEVSFGGRSAVFRRVLLLLCGSAWVDGVWLSLLGAACFPAFRFSISIFDLSEVNSLLSDINSVINQRCEVMVRFCSTTSRTISPYDKRKRAVSSGSIECFRLGISTNFGVSISLGVSIGKVKAASELKQVPRSLAPACGLPVRLQLPRHQLFAH